MTFRMLVALAGVLLTVSACVVEPYGGGGRGDHDRGDEHGRGNDYPRGDHFRGDHFRTDQGQPEYGRRVWHD